MGSGQWRKGRAECGVSIYTAGQRLAGTWHVTSGKHGMLGIRVVCCCDLQ